MAGADYGVLIFNKDRLLNNNGNDTTYKGIDFLTCRGTIFRIKNRYWKIDGLINELDGFNNISTDENIVFGKYEHDLITAFALVDEHDITYMQIDISGIKFYTVGGYIYNDILLETYFNSSLKDDFKIKNFQRIAIDDIKNRITRYKKLYK